LGGIITGKIGRIEAVHLGSYKMEGVVVNFPNPGDYDFPDSLKSSDVFRNGAIGGELLRRFTVVFNFPGDKMYIKKNAFFGRKFNYNLSGLTFRAKGVRLRRYEITDVRKGSSGDAAGLLVGDELVSVNGVPASYYNLNGITTVFDIQPGKRLRVEIMRNGKTIVKKMQLVSQI
jgi:hypothetical protein